MTGSARRTGSREKPGVDVNFTRSFCSNRVKILGCHRLRTPSATLLEVWIPGSSTYGAHLAAMLGLPFAFAAHFAPAEMQQAVSLYRARFQPSEHLAAPRVMLGVNVFAADTDATARRLFSSLQQAFLNLRRGRPGKLPPPIDNFDAGLDRDARAMLANALAGSIVGGPETVRDGLRAFIASTGADELMVTAQIFDHAARKRSFEILAMIHQETAEADR
jgi:luciferase family oxidoreductase group 1